MCNFPFIAVKLGPGFAAHTCDGVRGTSGAPILLRNDDDQFVAVAIQSGWRRLKLRKSKKKLVLGRAAMVEQFADAIPHFLAHAKIVNSD
ncbi:MAG: hypothetical protein ACR2PG_15070 [Hyphomicrobiaceae bacterium]